MKKHVFLHSALLLIVVLALFACKNNKAQISSDVLETPASSEWEGTYTGTIPCADCPGIKLQVTLNKNGKHSIISRYEERSGIFYECGGFRFNDDSTKIRLYRGCYELKRFIVQDNKLVILDVEGNPIEDADISLYTLNKIESSTSLTNKYWVLTELADDYGSAYLNHLLEESDKIPYMQFDEQGTISGFTSCNRFTGIYALKDESKIEFSKMVSTRMMCLNQTQSVEDALFKVFQNIDSYKIENDKLLFIQNETVIARFDAAYLK